MVYRGEEEFDGEIKASVAALKYYLEDEVCEVKNVCPRLR